MKKMMKKKVMRKKVKRKKAMRKKTRREIARRETVRAMAGYFISVLVAEKRGSRDQGSSSTGWEGGADRSRDWMWAGHSSRGGEDS